MKRPRRKSPARVRTTLVVAWIAFVAAAAGAGVAPVAAQGSEAEAVPDPEAVPDLEALRARWWNKSEEERRVLRERFELLRRLPDPRRRELLERARAWTRVEEELRREAPEAVRREIDGLGPEASRERWRELAHRRGQEMGRHRLDRLPPGLRWRLEHTPPAERRFVLERFLRERDLRSRRALIAMGRRAGLPPERIRELAALPPERRLDAILELRRRLHGADERDLLGDPELFRPPGPGRPPRGPRRAPWPRPPDERHPPQR